MVDSGAASSGVPPVISEEDENSEYDADSENDGDESPASEDELAGHSIRLSPVCCECKTDGSIFKCPVNDCPHFFCKEHRMSIDGRKLHMCPCHESMHYESVPVAARQYTRNPKSTFESELIGMITNAGSKIPPEVLRARVNKGGYEEILMDSGAVTHVCPTMFSPESYTLPPGRNDPELRNASGVVLKSYGTRRVEFQADGMRTQISGKAIFRLRDVKRAIFSVPELCDKHNKVVFEKKGGYVENLHTKGRIYFRRKGKLYVLDAKLASMERQGIMPITHDLGQSGSSGSGTPPSPVYVHGELRSSSDEPSNAGAPTGAPAGSSTDGDPKAKDEIEEYIEYGDPESKSMKSVRVLSKGDLEDTVAKIRAMKTPVMPSEAEQEEHNLIHVKFEAWCDPECIVQWCVRKQHQKVRISRRVRRPGSHMLRMDEWSTSTSEFKGW